MMALRKKMPAWRPSVAHERRPIRLTNPDLHRNASLPSGGKDAGSVRRSRDDGSRSETPRPAKARAAPDSSNRCRSASGTAPIAPSTNAMVHSSCRSHPVAGMIAPALFTTVANDRAEERIMACGD